MKNIITIVTILICSSCCSTKITAQTPPPITDTLQWLKVNIEQKSSFFKNKPFSVILDTLAIHGLKNSLTEYSHPNISDDQPAHTIANFTINTRSLIIYFEPFVTSNKTFLHNSYPDTINTHIKWMAIEFTQPVSYLNSPHMPVNFSWYSIEALVKDYIVYSVKVGEY